MKDAELGAYCGVILIYYARADEGGSLVVPRERVDKILSLAIGQPLSPEVANFAIRMLNQCNISYVEDDPVTGTYVGISARSFDAFVEGVVQDQKRYNGIIESALDPNDGINDAESLSYNYLDKYNKYPALRRYVQFGDEWIKELLQKLKSGYAEGGIVPASDRLVSVNDNDPKVAEIRDAARELRTALEISNDLGRMNAEQVQVAVDEVRKIEVTFQSKTIRASAAYRMASDSLSWIAREAGGAVVGTAALALLALIAKFLGF